MPWQFITDNCTSDSQIQYNTDLHPEINSFFNTAAMVNNAQFFFDYRPQDTKYSMRQNKQLRQILVPYLMNGLSINIQGISTVYDGTTLIRNNMENVKTNIFHRAANKTIHVYFAQTKGSNAALTKTIYNMLREYWPEQNNKLLSASLSGNSQHQVLLWASENDNKCVYVWTTAITPSLIIKTLALLSKVLPKLLDNAEYPVPETLFYEQGKMNGPEYAKIFLEWFNSCWPKLKCKENLAVFRQTLEAINTRKEQALSLTIDTQQRSVNDLEQTYLRSCQELRKLQYQLIGLKSSESAINTEELVNYFSKKPQIHKLVNTPDSITLILRVPCIYYDEDSVKTMLNSSRLNDINGNLAPFFKRIFVDEMFTIYFHSALTWRITNTNRNERLVEPRTGYGSDFPANAIPNPHHNKHLCMGNHAALISKALMNNDYIYALEQSIVSVGSLHFGDSIVIHSFADVISNNSSWYTVPCVQSKTNPNVWLTPRQMYMLSDEQLAELIKTKEGENNDGETYPTF